MGFNATLRKVRPVPQRFILLALIAACLGLGGWVLWGVALPKGLPRGLLEKQRQLTEFSLPRSVDRLDWVADTIKVLNASGTKIRSLRGLPASLRELDASYTSIQSLESVPRDLKALDIRETRIEHLVGLPPHLESLKVGNQKISRLGRLPDSLQDLYLENTSINDLTGLPPHLRELYLEGKSFENLDGLPEALQSLTLVATNVKTLKNLPPSLQVLKLKNNIHLRFQASDLPPLLTLLEIELNQPAPDLSGLKYLTWFSDRRELPSPPPLPSFLSSLTLRTPGWTELPKLPRSLRALGLLSANLSLKENLPPELEVLDLAGYSKPELESLRSLAHLRKLKIDNSNIMKLPELPEQLEVLVLSGKRVNDLRGLPRNLKELVFYDSGLERLDGVRDLPRSLERLDLSNSRSFRDLASVPVNLVYLNLGGTGISRLPNLGDALQELDVSNTKLKAIAPHSLPGKLSALTLNEGQVQDLEELPPGIKTLRFVPLTYTP